LLVGCSTAEAPPADSANEAAAPGGTGEAAATEIEPAPPATIADLFPDDPVKEMVLNNCAGCHAAACTTIGQRTTARWNSLQEGHQDHVPSLSDEDRGAIFAYLSSNFNDSLPEPVVPPHFLEAGCTPF
jgi:mono/diheme cytochrome c family protein